MVWDVNQTADLELSSDRFSWPDYTILGATMALSSAVGIYYGVVERNKRTMDEYLMAGRDMHFVPVSLSLFVSWMSAISFIADPVEVYYYGAIYVIYALGYCLALPVAAHLFAPVFYRLRLTSVFEFLETHYNVTIRTIVSVCVGLSVLLYLSVVLFAAAVAFSRVCGLEIWLCVVLIGFICLFYTSIGGMKAVIWADALQFLLMFIGLFAVVIRGFIHLGGFWNVWNISTRGERINFRESFNPNPFERSTFWTLLIGGFFRVLNPMISGQMFVQRYCTLRSERDVKLCIYLNMPIYCLFVGLFALAGLLLCAMYHTCDPLKAERITQSDQMMSLMVLDLLKPLPGLAGLFIGSILSASLSTMSSAQSSLATTLMSDVIKPIYRHRTKRILTESWSSRLAKLSTAAMGLINIILSLSVILIKDSTVFGLSMAFINAFLAPVSGVFVLAIIFPSIRTNSVLIGGIASTVISCSLTMGTLIQGANHPRLPTSTTGCRLVHGLSANSSTQGLSSYTSVNTGGGYVNDEEGRWYSVDESTSFLHLITHATLNSTTFVRDNNLNNWTIYKFSPILYPVLGPVICILVALLITALTRLWNRLCYMGDDVTGQQSFVTKHEQTTLENDEEVISELLPIKTRSCT